MVPLGVDTLTVLVAELEGVWGAEGEDEGEAPGGWRGRCVPVKEEVAVGAADGVIEAVPLETRCPWAFR
jgi:hypothetical protein